MLNGKLIRSHTDKVLVGQRVLEQFLKLESEHIKHKKDYMKDIQEHLTAKHRKIVTDWMLKVCQEQHLLPQVFLSAVQYLDCVLNRLSIKRENFQLLSCACLLLSSKLNDPQPLSLYQLVIFTDCSITVTELRDMELRVLTILHWELNIPSSLQFLELLLNLLEPTLSLEVLAFARENIPSLLTYNATHYKFYNVKPSLMVRFSRFI